MPQQPLHTSLGAGPRSLSIGLGHAATVAARTVEDGRIEGAAGVGE